VRVWLLVLGTVIAGVVVYLLIDALRKRRVRRLARSRPAHSIDVFAASLRPDVPENVARAVYQRLQAWQAWAVPGFPVNAADDLGEVYGIVGEDVDELCRDLLEDCRVAPPPPEVIAALPGVSSVSDLARFVVACSAR
jgi:hypothetical protein